VFPVGSRHRELCQQHRALGYLYLLGFQKSFKADSSSEERHIAEVPELRGYVAHWQYRPIPLLHVHIAVDLLPLNERPRLVHGGVWRL
jgi:hypothetical protein